MKGIANKRFALALCLILIMVFSSGCGSLEDFTEKGLPKMIDTCCQYITANAAENPADSQGSAWNIIVLKLADAEMENPEYFDSYYDDLCKLVKEKKGILDPHMYTPYERASMALALLGKDPTDVCGYDLMSKVDEYQGVKNQGINAEIYALLSAHCTGYKLKNEEKYLQDILDAQGEDGAITFDGVNADVDLTAMALQALSLYSDRCASEIEKGLDYLEREQGEDGSYGNLESTAQVAIALAVLGRDPVGDEQFEKGGNDLTDGMLVYWTGEGFRHDLDSEDIDMMAMQQGLLAMEAISFCREGKSIFDGE